jgi:peptidyl-prolyl cis-trans isomerase D
VRELYRVGTRVSDEEVKAEFEQKNLQANLEYARFTARKYEDEQGEPTAAEVDKYIAEHKDDLKKAYDDRAFLYKKVDRQARLRHVLVEAPKDAPADKQAAAKKTIDGAAATVKAGTPFAEVAKKASTEGRSQKRGGLIGWRKKGFTGFGDKLDEKVFAKEVKKGDVIGPEQTDRGWELVLVEDFREGDVSLEQAQREIAEELVLAEKARSRARADAQAALDKVKGGAKLEELFPKKDKEKEEEAPPKKGMETPKLMETGLFPRKGDMVQDIGVSKELAKKAFAMKPGELAGPFDVGGGVVIVRCKERKDPDMTDFEKRKADLRREYERTKWATVVDAWAKQRCTEVKNDGRIRVNDEILAYDLVQPGKPVPKSGYEPCAGSRLPF